MGFDPLDEFVKKMRELVRDLENTMRRQLAMEAEAIEPLYTVNQYPDRYEVIIDMPLADLSVLSVSIRDQRLTVECALREKIRFERWSVHRSVEHRAYRLELRLPPDVIPEEAVVEKSEAKSMIRVRIPRRPLRGLNA
ncbi:Hsp20/alpha crystallin family protein [Desulfurococcus mucosus]|uniref:SHSP domain-containing protein n=1 Tax=Desulfurococcus mucosus (strain ATCC 35584 / DSM 2162 / JCM 9187 / O7/1) TaxID=765177 RepID=E8R7L0_DESM0|nr:Hsp20/alpha crystallin family protein [Desulfurococcus mucosus]ADV64505.1 hypothetical protein Desmu_0186 [Desulfurococcus mucosus DSM 2162]